ncbi:hypothetical protein PR048_020892 [Dryococelus australis]|uniref:Uncharacterized protein n=1 Tax=Dryococelus australis TaxID=614101 RepID=A0ABQ9GWP5_9NEOP|nr:hypothetical protein PR048_020892 [Dryococelus australis]
MTNPPEAKKRDHYQGSGITQRGTYITIAAHCLPYDTEGESPEQGEAGVGKCCHLDIKSPVAPGISARVEQIQTLSDLRHGAHAPWITVRFNNHHIKAILETAATGNFIQSQLPTLKQKTRISESSQIIEMAQYKSRLAIEGTVTLPVSVSIQNV